MRIIDVPAVEKEAYNPDRPISELIQMQLIHLSTAEQTLPPKQRTGVNISALHTEGQAADYIQKITAKLQRAAKAKTKRPSKKSAAKRKKKTAKKTTPAKSEKRRKARKGRK